MMTCLDDLDISTRLLAPASYSRFCTRLTHVIYTPHAIRYHPHVISCYAHHSNHVRTPQSSCHHILHA